MQGDEEEEDEYGDDGFEQDVDVEVDGDVSDDDAVMPEQSCIEVERAHSTPHSTKKDAGLTDDAGSTSQDTPRKHEDAFQETEVWKSLSFTEEKDEPEQVMLENEDDLGKAKLSDSPLEKPEDAVLVDIGEDPSEAILEEPEHVSGEPQVQQTQELLSLAIDSSNACQRVDESSSERTDNSQQIDEIGFASLSMENVVIASHVDVAQLSEIPNANDSVGEVASRRSEEGNDEDVETYESSDSMNGALVDGETIESTKADERLQRGPSTYSIVVRDCEEISNRTCTPQLSRVGSANFAHFSKKESSREFNSNFESSLGFDNCESAVPLTFSEKAPQSDQSSEGLSSSYYIEDYVPSSTKTSPPPTSNGLGLLSQEGWFPIGAIIEARPTNHTNRLVEALQKRNTHVRPSSDPGMARDPESNFERDEGRRRSLPRSTTLQVPDDLFAGATQKEQAKRQTKSAGARKIRSTNFASRGPRCVKMRPVKPQVNELEKEEEEEQQPLIEAKEEAPVSEPIVEEEILPPELPEEEPISYMTIQEAHLQPTRDKISGLLWNFEGAESKDEVEARLRLTNTKRRGEVVREADKFLNMMKQKGGGSVTVAWRRHFDSDGDGELSFLEFCNALADLNYEVDTAQLWHEFGGGNGHKHVGLEMIDPHGANVLDFFSSWCRKEKGGAIEVFREIDADGSDSLEPHEFIEGLGDLGFFDLENLPESIDSEDKVLQNLYPLLDQNGHGCIQAEAMLFLEQDRQKRARHAREIQRARDFGVDPTAGWEVSNDAFKILSETTMGCTQLGGTFWKMIPENNRRGSYDSCKVSSSPSRKGSTQSSPKAMVFHGKSRSHSSIGKAFHREIACANSATPKLSTSVSLPHLPSDSKKAKFIAAQQSNAGIRMRSTQKLRGARNIYGGAQTSVLPAVPSQRDRVSKPMAFAESRRGQKDLGSTDFCGGGNDMFDPKSSAPMDFFLSCNSRALFDRYYG